MYFSTKYLIGVFCFQIYEGRRKLGMYNVRQKFRIQNTIAITVLVYNITLMEPKCTKSIVKLTNLYIVLLTRKKKFKYK